MTLGPESSPSAGAGDTQDSAGVAVMNRPRQRPLQRVGWTTALSQPAATQRPTSPHHRLAALLGLLGIMLGCRANEAAPTTSGSGGMPAQLGGATTSGGGAEPAGAGGASLGGSAGGGGSAAGGGGTQAAELVVAVGPFASCVVDAQQAVKCGGRCGPAFNGGSRDVAPAGLRARALAVGREFACAVLLEPQAGSVVTCWGREALAAAPVLPDVVELSAGDAHACARSGEGEVTCWGDPAHAVPVGVMAKSIAASGAMTCAVNADDSVRCWGPRPAPPPPELRATRIALSSQLSDPTAGPRFGCAITLGGEVRCWGDEPGPVQTPPTGLVAKALAVGGRYACAITLDDGVTCWGTPPRFAEAMPPGLRASALSMSFRSAAAVTPEHSFVFWGETAGRSQF